MSAALWSVDPLLVQAQQAGVLTIEEASALDDLAEQDADDLPDDLVHALERLADWMQRFYH
jgi:hypothetical protein